MPAVRRASHFIACLALSSTACSSSKLARSPEHPRAVGDDSVICRAATNRFVGLPGLDPGSTATPDSASHGSWWIRGCSVQRVESGLRLRFEGPGWYFIDRHEGDFALRQQVAFTLGVELEGTPELTLDKGVAALRFEPKTTPRVQVHVARDLNLHPTSAWGSLISWVPGVPVRGRAAERLSALAVTALSTKLLEGATATYELTSGQRDLSLGRLAAGQTPRNAFSDGIRWLVNERVFLPPNATQVVGPIEPGVTRLDTRIEQGDGLVYRTVCQRDMPAQYAAIASGHLDRLPVLKSAAQGTVRGTGEQSTILRVDECKFFVALAPLGNSTTIAALRVRG